MPWCNVTASHKLPLMLTGKFLSPRSFKSSDLHVVCKVTTRGRMPRDLRAGLKLFPFHLLKVLLVYENVF